MLYTAHVQHTDFPLHPRVVQLMSHRGRIKSDPLRSQDSTAESEPPRTTGQRRHRSRLEEQRWCKGMYRQHIWSEMTCLGARDTMLSTFAFGTIGLLPSCSLIQSIHQSQPPSSRQGFSTF